jgi:hypothetical protein
MSSKVLLEPTHSRQRQQLPQQQTSVLLLSWTVLLL